jgi:hypothetical protein
MPTNASINRIIDRADREKLEQLEKRYDALLEQLFADPSSEKLSREVRLIEVDIVRLTGEGTIHY